MMYNGSVEKKKEKLLDRFSDRAKKIAAIITSTVTICAAVAGFGNWLVNTITAHTTEQVQKIQDELENVKNEVKSIKLDETRLQLLVAINTTPDDTKTILEIARVYFLELKGDWYMTPKFIAWARKHDIDITGFTFTD